MPRKRTRLLAGVVALCLTGAVWVTLASGPTATGAAGQPGDTTRASVIDGDPGAESPQGGGDTMVSGNGRYVTFDTLAELQPSGPGNGQHGKEAQNTAVFVRDLRAHQTNIVSVAQDGQQVLQANGDSKYPSITADGRYVSFLTNATDISGANDAFPRLMVCDRGAPDAAGVYRQPPALNGTYPGFSCVTVATVAYPQGFVPNDDVGGVDSRPTLAADGALPIGDGVRALRIAWTSFDTGNFTTSSAYVAQIVVNPDGTLQGAATVQTISNAASTEAGLSYVSPALSADGQWLALAAYRYAGSGISPLNAIVEAHLGTGLPQVRRIDVAEPGPTPSYLGSGTRAVGHPSISSDGSVVAFDYDNQPVPHSDDPRSNYGPAPGNYEENYPDVYTVDVDTTPFDDPASQPVTTGAQLVSSVYDGTATVGPGDGAKPALSADGRYVAFVTDRPGMWAGPDGPRSTASCLSAATPVEVHFADPHAARAVPAQAPPAGQNDPRTLCQVVARDLPADAAERAAGDPLPAAQLASPSINACTGGTAGDTCPGDSYSFDPITLSATGREVGYDSFADDLVPGDTGQNDGNGFYYVDSFVRTWTPQLSVTPNPVDYGTVQVGTSSTKDFTATVTGFGPVDVGDITITGTASGDFTVQPNDCANQALHEDSPCPFSVTFTPSTSGDRGSTITVHDGDDATNDVIIPVTAVGTPKPTTPPPTSPPPTTPPPTTPPPTTPPPTTPGELAVGPSSIDFGTALPLRPGGTKRTVTITNTGGQGITITSVTVTDGVVTGASGDYTVEQPSQANGCLDAAGQLPPGRSCTLTITWVGRAIGSRGAVLVVKTGTETRAVPLVASVPTPKITVNPAVVVGGRVTQVTGEGFAPKRTVTVQVPFASDPSLKTDAKGRFTTSLVLLYNAPGGPVTVVATMPGLDPSISARTPLLVVLGTVQGPILVTRH